MTRTSPRRPLAGCLIGGLLVFFLTAPAGAQAFRLGIWDGTLEGVVDVNRRDMRTRGAPLSRDESLATQETLSLRNSGAYVLDPRLFSLTVGGTFGLSQEWFETTGPGSEFREGMPWGYEVLAALLPERPLSLSLFATRTQSVISREFSGRSEVMTETRGARLSVQQLYVPSTLAFRQERVDDEFRAGDLTTRRKEERNILTYQGQRGWEDAELDARYEFVDHSDRVLPQLGYRSHEAVLNSSLDFGPELNRHWDSRLRGFVRSGDGDGGMVLDLTTLTVDEALRVDHTDRLRSEYRYLLAHTDTPGGASTTQTATATLEHRLYESLTTTATARGTVGLPPDGEQYGAGGLLDFAYTKRLPGGGRLSAGLGAGLDYEDDRFRRRESAALQETQTAATPFALPIRLRQPFVDEASVVVTKVAVGPLPVGCSPPAGPPTPLVPGRDYTLRTVGEVTEIVPLPCSDSAPGINPGDTIAVDYRFSVSPSLTFVTASWHAGLTVDYGWIRVFGSHNEWDQHLLAGQDGRFLNDQRSDAAGAELRYDGRRLDASLLGEARRLTSTRTSYDTLRSTQSLGLEILRDLRLGLTAEETWTDYRDEDRRSQSLSGRATLTWAVVEGLFAEAMAGYGRLEDTLLPTERVNEGRLRLVWRFRSLEVSGALGFLERRRGDTDTREYRGLLRLIRRF